MTVAFTIAAALAYLFLLIPFYLLCIAHLMGLVIKNRQKKVSYQRFLLYPIAIFQTLLILSSPASCYGFKQGRACYSFIQTHLTSANLNSFQNAPPHWHFVESTFPIALLLYAVSVAVFLGMLRFQLNEQ